MAANPAALAGLLALVAGALCGWHLCRIIHNTDLQPIELPLCTLALGCGAITCAALGILLLVRGCVQAGGLQ